MPITYVGANGKQYVAIVAAGAAAIDDPDPPEAQTLVVYSATVNCATVTGVAVSGATKTSAAAPSTIA